MDKMYSLNLNANGKKTFIFVLNNSFLWSKTYFIFYMDKGTCQMGENDIFKKKTSNYFYLNIFFKFIVKNISAIVSRFVTF